MPKPIHNLLSRAALAALLLVAAAVPLLHSPAPAQAAINEQINLQSRVTDPDGNIVGDGTYNMEFKLMTVASGGDTTQGSCTTSCVWIETRTSGNRVTISRGLMSIQLGSVSTLSGVNFNQDLYLSIRVGGTGGSPTWDPEMSPRDRLGAAPTAIFSANSDQLNGQNASYYLNAANLTGTLADARLSSNVPLKNAANVFSASQEINNAGGKTTLQLSNTGTDTGLTIGGDTNLYRSAGNMLKTDDNLTIDGGLALVQSATSPTLRLAEASSTTSYLDIVDSSEAQSQINKTTNSGGSFIDLNPRPSDGVSDSQIRLFRTTNTSGAAEFAIYKGDNTSTLNHHFLGNGDVTLNRTAGNLGIGDTNPSTKVSVGGTGSVNGITLGDDAANAVNLYRSTTDRLQTDDTFEALAYRANGSAGATTTCSGGQFLQNQVVVGGITTGGTCASASGSGTVTSLTEGSNIDLSPDTITTTGSIGIVNNPSFSTSVTTPTLIGGTGAGNNLTLSSTSNGTKGKLLFGNSTYDEANNRLGIGTTTPQRALDVQADSSGGVTAVGLYNANTTNNNSTVISYRSDSTGAGATAYKEFGAQRVRYTEHDNSTAGSEYAFFNQVNGTLTQNLTIDPQGEIGIGSGATNPGYKLDVQGGDINASGVYRVAGSAGASTTCSGGQFLQNQVVVGGITTGGTCAAAGGSSSLQGAYDGGNAITTTSARDIDITLADTATDSNFVLDVATGSTSEFQVENNGTDVLQIGSAGQLQLDTQGSGGGILLGGDSSIYRQAANNLRSNSHFYSGGVVAANTGGANETRLGWDCAAQAAAICFGNGSDTNLYRSAANVLKTDDSFSTGSISGVTTFSSAGTWLAANGQFTGVVGTAGTPVQRLAVTGDSAARFRITNDGIIDWGDGSATPDTSLYRSGADTLSLGADDDFLVIGSNSDQMFFRSDANSAYLSYNLSDETDWINVAQKFGDSDERFSTQVDGKLSWGPGNAGVDTNLYRSAADTLKTDDNLTIGSSDTTGRLLTLDVKTDAGDPTGSDGAMYFNDSSGTFRCFQNNSGWTDCLGIPRPNTRRHFYAVHPGSGTTFNLLGDIATAGTAPTNVAATTSEPSMLNYATGTTSGNVNHVSGNTNYDTDNNILFQTYGVNQTTSSIRVWRGITNQTAATMAGSANPAGNYAAFRFDTGAGDTNWQCITKDNSTQNIQNSGIAGGNTTGRKFEILQSSSAVEFKIDGAIVCNNTTNLPAANTLMRYANTVTTLAASAANLRTSWIYVESNK